MFELQSLMDNFDKNVLEMTKKYKNDFIFQIGQSFQEFNEKIESNQLVYNSENKLIKLKLSKNVERKSLVNESESYEIVKNKIKFINETLFYFPKINIGGFHKTNLNLFIYISDEIIKNNFRKLFRVYEINFHKNVNKTRNENFIDDTTINDIYKQDENFGDSLISLINFFTYDKEEDKITHLIQVFILLTRD